MLSNKNNGYAQSQAFSRRWKLLCVDLSLSLPLNGAVVSSPLLMSTTWGEYSLLSYLFFLFRHPPLLPLYQGQSINRERDRESQTDSTLTHSLTSFDRSLFLTCLFALFFPKIPVPKGPHFLYFFHHKNTKKFVPHYSRGQCFSPINKNRLKCSM